MLVHLRIHATVMMLILIAGASSLLLSVTSSPRAIISRGTINQYKRTTNRVQLSLGDDFGTPSLGAPRGCPVDGSFATSGGVGVTRSVSLIPWNHVESEVDTLVDLLDVKQGVLLASSYEFPGRYARWTIGFVDPPLEISGCNRQFKFKALNERGVLMLNMVLPALKSCSAVASLSVSRSEIVGRILEPEQLVVSEEDRSKQPSLLSVVRAASLVFYYPDEAQLGLYGALGYDLMFQFEPIELTHPRDPRQRDVVLYMPDSILVVDKRENRAWKVSYEFTWCTPGAASILDTTGLPRVGALQTFLPNDEHLNDTYDMPPGGFAQLVDVAKHEFECGNLFEVVLSQEWRRKSKASPSALFRMLRKRNPSPYGFLMNLGSGGFNSEYLVGASPEMFVRVERVGDGRLRVETCPISGTIARGADALEDATQVRTLLASEKDESELTMCTDVDRNDKSRVCEAGSVSVLGRRQIEMYSRLIHTVDHVEGYLRDGYDALDAFLCHTWAVTVTGAPKSWAARFIERHERSPRAWYGGAVGHIGFDGSLNTGLTLRSIHLVDGVAAVRAGATLLFDSDGKLEEAETELKASAMMDALTSAADDAQGSRIEAAHCATTDNDPRTVGVTKRVLLVDHEDSFVHTLANYLRQTGAEVRVCRFGYATRHAVAEEAWDLIVLSPGPGRPSDFNVTETLDMAIKFGIPVFGVCLGLQGLVEYFGGSLGQLPSPVHGKPALVDTDFEISEEVMQGMNWGIFDGLPGSFEVARYHSLFAMSIPKCLIVTARTRGDDIVMAVEHETMPLAAVQFHPESILTNPRHGLRILANCLVNLRSHGATGT